MSTYDFKVKAQDGSEVCGVDTLTKDKVSLERLYQKGYRDGEKISSYLFSGNVEIGSP